MNHVKCEICGDVATLIAVGCGVNGDAYACAAHRHCYDATEYAAIHYGWRVQYKKCLTPGAQVETQTLILCETWGEWAARSIEDPRFEEEELTPHGAILAYIRTRDVDANVCAIIEPGELTADERVAAALAKQERELLIAWRRYLAQREAAAHRIGGEEERAAVVAKLGDRYEYASAKAEACKCSVVLAADVAEMIWTALADHLLVALTEIERGEHIKGNE